jgi:inosose dehydratase
VRFLRQHHDRIPYLHLKSVDGSVREIVQRNDTPRAEAVSMGIFREPADGVVDFIGLRDALQAVDYDGWAIVEQDMYPAPPDKPLPIAKRMRAYFKHIGLG